MNEKVSRMIYVRGIKRLCHFTKSSNLLHIIDGRVGLLSTSHLKKSERFAFNPTDLKRLDGHPDHICCSIEYPNTFYLRKAISEDPIFKDWVIIAIDASVMCCDNTLFCERNAAAGSGAYIRGDENGLEAMFADDVTGSYGLTFSRTPERPDSCPTDVQAEVLIHRAVPANRIIDVIVRDEAQAKNEVERSRLMGVSPFPFRISIAPVLYDANKLANMLSNGILPSERRWYEPEATNDD